MDNINQILKYRRVVQKLLDFPDRQFTIRELSLETKTPYPTTWRLIRTLESTGLITTRKIGHSTLCQLNPGSPYLKEVRKALALSPSPHKMAVTDFVQEAKKIPEIKRVILYGSVAKGKEKPTSNIDLAILVTKKTPLIEERINNAILAAMKKSRMKLAPLMLTREELEQDKKFKRELEGGEALYERA
jgi:predicted nucleotidyltransferase